MVDIDDGYGDDDSSSSGSSKKKKKKKKKTKSKSSGDVPSAVQSEIDIDERVEESSVSQTSQDWAKKYGDINPSKGSSGSLQQYIKEQEEECREFYQNMGDMAVETAANGAQKFTLAHHAMILNMAHNRTGIKETLEDEFGMSEKKAVKTANKICSNAGEYKAFVRTMNKIMKDGLEVKDMDGMV